MDVPRWFSRFLPPHLRQGDDDASRRALLTAAACLATTGVAALIAALQAVSGVGASALAAGACAAGGAALLGWLRARGAWRRIAALLCGTIWLGAFAVVLTTGGGMVTALYYLIFAAALATVLLGRSAGTLVAFASVSVIVAVNALHAAGWHGPVAVEAEVGLRSALRGALVFTLALLPLVAGYDWLKRSALRDSERSERRYRALAQYGADLIAELDGAGRIVHASASASAPRLRLVGRLALDGVHPEDRPLLLAAFRQLEVQPSVRVGPLRWGHGDANARWFEASLTAFEEDGRRRLLVVARDVGRRIELERELRQSHKMQAIGQLAGGAAHDFNNLLMAISGEAELLLRRKGLDENVRAALEQVLGATERGAELSRRLLALARPGPRERRLVDLNAVARGLEPILARLLGEDVELALELAPDLGAVRADAGEIEQMLLNLALNARDAMPSGGALRISTRAHGDVVELEVADSGGGIDALARERIFEPFYTTKKEGRGVGLGLFVVYSIVTDLGGAIRVDSALGAGARFTLTLPVASERLAARSAARLARLRGGHERILLVEDRRELLDLMRAALESEGYTVLVAMDGIEALALAAREPVDLVVTDVVMPRMGGRTLVRTLRETRPDLRALFVSGHPERAPEPSALAPGDRLLRKPFLLCDLCDAARAALDAPAARSDGE
jgi:PAS domain S-box-containing protein